MIPCKRSQFTKRTSCVQVNRLVQAWPFGDADAVMLVSGLMRKDGGEEDHMQVAWMKMDLVPPKDVDSKMAMLEGVRIDMHGTGMKSLQLLNKLQLFADHSHIP